MYLCIKIKCINKSKRFDRKSPNLVKPIWAEDITQSRSEERFFTV